MTDIIQFDATFDTVEAAARSLLQNLEGLKVRAAEIGDQMEVDRLAGIQGQVRGQIATRQPGVAEKPIIEENTAALAKENAVRGEGVQLTMTEISELEAKARLQAETTAQYASAVAAENALLAEQMRLKGQLDLFNTAGQPVDYEGQLAAQNAEIARQTELRVADAKAAQEQAVAVAEQRAAALQGAAVSQRGAAFKGGAEAAFAGQAVPASKLASQVAAPATATKEEAAAWQATTAATIEASAAQGSYAAFALASGRATAEETAALEALGIEMRGVDVSASTLGANFTRLSLAENESSNTLRKHGALTTEYLGALARGETTVAEFGYQIGATIGKFAGWTAAAAATYGTLGAVVELGKGAIDSASGVQQLTRTIDGLDRNQASIGLQNLAAEVNVPMKEAGDAVFAFSRTFHTLDGAINAARVALAAYHLDGVAVTDSVKAETAIHQQFGVTAAGMTGIFDKLAQGQQKFNARISDMIPLLQRSAGAVKNAGGNLDDYMQLATIALRTTQLSGAQLGTVFQRAAANYLNPVTTKGQADRADLQTLGIQTKTKTGEDVGFTDLMKEILKFTATATDKQRAQVGLDVAGSGFGGRIGGLFGGGGAALQAPVAAAYGDSKGVLAVELKKELGTARQEMAAFINGLQQIGAALANSGALVGFGVALKTVDAALQGIRGVIDIFDQLPQSTREVISGLVELRLAMLFLSRTKFGGSIADATGLSAIGRATGLNQGAAGRFGFGFGQNDNDKARQTLALGTRGALTKVQDSISSTIAESNTNAGRMVTLEAEHEALVTQMADKEGATTARLKAANAISVELNTLAAEQTRLAGQLVAERTVEADTQKRLNSYQAISRKNRASPEAVQTRTDEVNATGTKVAPVILSDASKAKDFAAATEANTIAQEKLAAAEGVEMGALEENALATEAAAASMRLSAAATAKARIATEAQMVPAAEEGASGLAGLAGGLGGMVAALDPLTIGLLALPFAFEAINQAGKHTDDALSRAAKAAGLPITTLAGLKKHSDALAKEAALLKDPSKLWGDSDVSGFFKALTGGGRQGPPDRQPRGTPAQFGDASLLNPYWSGTPIDPSSIQLAQARATAYANKLNAATAAKTPQGKAQVAADYTRIYDGLAASAKSDTDAVPDTGAGRAKWAKQIAALKAKALALTISEPSAQSAQSLRTIDDKIDKIVAAKQKTIDALTTNLGKNVFAGFKLIGTKQLEANLTSADDEAKVFGATDTKQQITRAAEIYQYLVQQVAKAGKDVSATDLQKLATAQSAMESTANKLVGDLVAAAASATSTGEQQADFAKGYAAVEAERAAVEKALELAIAAAKGNNKLIKAARDAAAQSLIGINTRLESVLTPDLAAIDLQTASNQAAITGTSSEADIQRQNAAIAGAREKLARARSIKGTPISDITGLQNDLAGLVQQRAQSISSQADSLLSAQGQLAVSSIMGLGPAADLARASATIGVAQRKLAADKNSGKDQATIISDQAAVDDALHSYDQLVQSQAQTLHQDMAAAIDASVALEQSQTTDPVKQAQEQLQGDIKHLSTIVRSDFNSQLEYMTALKTQRAKINTDRQNKIEAVATADEATANYDLAMHTEGDSAYIAQLEKILKLKKLSLATRRRINQEIYSAEHATDSSVELNVGNIKIPSIYQIRRAIGAGKEGQIPGSPSTVISHTSNITVNVYDGKDAGQKVGHAIDKALGTTVKAAMRAKGVR